jgi:uncharacterized ParB-like nuclease family protein
LDGASAVLSVVPAGGEAKSVMEVGELTVTHGSTLTRKALGRLTADIAENGMREPISYIAHNGRNYVVDGHHRLLAAERLGLKEVPVQRVNLPFRGYTTVEDLMQFVP